MTSSILHENINPFIRFSQIVLVDRNSFISTVQSYDHRLFFVLAGEGFVCVDGITYPARQNSVFLWTAGHPYSLYSENEVGMKLISVNFDYTKNNKSTVQFLPMVSPDNFNPEKVLEPLVFDDIEVLNSPIYVENMQEIRFLLEAMVQEFTNQESFYSSQLSSYFVLVLNNILRVVVPGKKNRSSRDIIKKVLSYIHEHYQEDITNQHLGEIFNYHPYYLSRLILAHTGTTLHQYLLSYRINKAIELLQNTDIPISEIAFLSGFNNISYFSQYFKKSTGYSPSAFRIVRKRP